MRKIFFIICVIMWPYTSMCANDSEYRTAMYDDLEQYLVNSESVARSDFETLRRNVIAEYPQIEQELTGQNEDVQVAILRGFLAHKAFEWYKQNFFSQLYATSAETGRAVRQSLVNNNTKNHRFSMGTYWLDGGIMDTEKCEWDFDKRQACDYPDGFEEFQLRYETSSGGTEILNLIKDDRKNNQHVRYSIELVYDSSIQTNNAYVHYYISVSEDVSKYDEWHKWRNADAADVRAGKFVRVKSKREPGSPFGKVRWEADLSRVWKSNYLPDAGLRSRTINYDAYFSGYESDE